MDMSASELDAVFDRLLARQQAAPQYAERVRRVTESMTKRHVSPAIIERVIRLNPDLREGYRLRGIHYKRYADDPAFNCGWITRGRAIRERGRTWLAGIPAHCKPRKGKRQYVTREAWVDYAPVAA